MVLTYLVFLFASSIVIGYVLIVHSFLRRDTSADAASEASAPESSTRGISANLAHRHA